MVRTVRGGREIGARKGGARESKGEAGCDLSLNS